MKKKIILFCLGLVCVNFISEAQITLTHADMPAAGLSYITFEDTSSFTSPGSAGAGQTWDFSNLTSQIYTDTITYVMPNTTPHFELFPSSNLAGFHSSLPWGLNFEMFAYYNSGLTAFTMEGAVVTYSEDGTNVTLEAHFSPSAREFNLPFTYNNTYTDINQSNTVTVYSPPMGFDSIRTVQYSTDYSVADGWGTIITPYGSYNSLRIKTINNGYDSTFYHTPGEGWSFGETSIFLPSTTYKWWANEIGIILIMNKWNNDYNFYDYTITKSSFPVSVHVNTINTQVKVFPNPAKDILFIQSDGKIRNVTCFNSVGQQVDVRFEENSIDISNLTAGLYFLNIIPQSGVAETRKFLKQ